jgi:NitT/TauT family transport system substrate-binding protein
MKKLWAVSFGLWVIAGFILTGVVSARAEGDDSLKIGYLPATGHGKIFVAQERGYFAEEGLKVELVEFINSADGIAAIRSGKIDVGGFGTVAPLLQISTGADLRVIGGLMGEDASIITTPEKAESLKKVADLKGKKVATIRLATGDVILRAAVHDAGLSWKDDLEIFELKGPGAVIEAVKNGQVDAGVVWGPHDASAINQGLKVVIVSADLYPGHPCCRLTVDGEQYQKRAADWKRFLRAVLKAERYALTGGPEHQKQTVDDIRKYAKLDADLIDKSYYHAHLDQSTDPNAEGVKNIWQIINEAGFVQTNEDALRFIETRAYQEALESLLAEEPADAYWLKLKEVFVKRNTGAYGGGREAKK